MSRSAQELKACCASAYASAAARWLLGPSFHPGGEGLTAHLVEALDVGPGALVVDVASGPGTSAVQAARATGCSVVGVDLSSQSVAAAERTAAEAGLAGRVRFLVGDAEALPLPDASADGILCECSFCTFPDKRAAAAEVARVLRPGARLALADVTAVPERLPAALRTLEAHVACLAGARPLAEVEALLEEAGLEVESAEPHDDALAELLAVIEGRLRLVGLGLDLAAAARRALVEGALGYAVVIARRRGSGKPRPTAAAAYQASASR